MDDFKSDFTVESLTIVDPRTAIHPDQKKQQQEKKDRKKKPVRERDPENPETGEIIDLTV